MDERERERGGRGLEEFWLVVECGTVRVQKVVIAGPVVGGVAWV